MLQPSNMVLDSIAILLNLWLRSPIEMLEIVFLLVEFPHRLNKHPKLVIIFITSTFSPYGTPPHKNSNKQTPRLHISDKQLYPLPLIISGAI